MSLGLGKIRQAMMRCAVMRWALRIGGWVLTLAATFAGLLAVTFFIGRKVPIDPVLAVLGDHASASAYAAARAQIRDRPLRTVQQHPRDRGTDHAMQEKEQQERRRSDPQHQAAGAVVGLLQEHLEADEVRVERPVKQQASGQPGQGDARQNRASVM